MAERAAHAGEDGRETTLPVITPSRAPKAWRLARRHVKAGRTVWAWSSLEADVRSGPGVRASRAARHCPTFGASASRRPRERAALSLWMAASAAPAGARLQLTTRPPTTGSWEAAAAVRSLKDILVKEAIVHTRMPGMLLLITCM